MPFVAALLAAVGLTLGVTSSTLLAPLRARAPRLACAQCVGFWAGAAWALAARWAPLDALGLAFATSAVGLVTARLVVPPDPKRRPTRAELTRAAADAAPRFDCGCDGEPRADAPPNP